jgi:hypothetical protein
MLSMPARQGSGQTSVGGGPPPSRCWISAPRTRIKRPRVSTGMCRFLAGRGQGSALKNGRSRLAETAPPEREGAHGASRPRNGPARPHRHPGLRGLCPRISASPQPLRRSGRSELDNVPWPRSTAPFAVADRLGRQHLLAQCGAPPLVISADQTMAMPEDNCPRAY